MDRSGKPVAKSQGVFEERDDRAGEISQDEIIAGYQEAVLVLRDRVEALEARIEESGIDSRLKRLEVDRGNKTEMHDRATSIMDKLVDRHKQALTRIHALEEKLNAICRTLVCEHEPICLPSSRGPVPLFAINIADERVMSIIAPGQPPPIAFAIAICRKCGLPYVAINTLEEASPFEGGPAPIPLVKPGEPVGGTGDLG